MKILFIGDICGKIGRKTTTKIVPKLKKQVKADLVIANAENIAHGKGVTQPTLEDLNQAGIDWFTTGDHAFKNLKQIKEIYDGNLPILRPANFPQQVAGRGYAVFTVNNNEALLINLIGRVYMQSNYDCPFRKLREILANFANQNLSAIIVDMHAEATSEKMALKHFADGQVSAILGTHTHVMTADSQITKKGTAYISDTGMVGYSEGVIGIDKQSIIESFLTQIKYPHLLPETGQAIFNAVLLDIDSRNAKTKSIKPIIKFVKIK